MDTIKFANGEVHQCSFLSTIPNGDTMQAFIALSDVTYVEAAEIFDDEETTAVMEYGDYRLVGYKLNKQSGGVYYTPYGIQAVLTGGHDERIE